MPGGVLRDGYRSSDAAWAPGEYLGFTLALCDSAPGTKPMTLRDAAGKPATLYDARSGSTMKLTTDHIAVIEGEARKHGMAVDRYVADVLKYTETR